MKDPKVENVWTATVNLVDSRQITINGNFYEGDDLPTRHQRLDEVMNLLERQRKRFEIPVMRKELEARYKALKTNMDQLEALSVEAKRKGDKAPAQMRMNMNTYRTNIDMIRKDIDDGQKAIEELEREVQADLVRAA